MQRRCVKELLSRRMKTCLQPAQQRWSQQLLDCSRCSHLHLPHSHIMTHLQLPSPPTPTHTRSRDSPGPEQEADCKQHPAHCAPARLLARWHSTNTPLLHRHGLWTTSHSSCWCAHDWVTGGGAGTWWVVACLGWVGGRATSWGVGASAHCRSSTCVQQVRCCGCVTVASVTCGNCKEDKQAAQPSGFVKFPSAPLSCHHCFPTAQHATIPSHTNTWVATWWWWTSHLGLLAGRLHRAGVGLRGVGRPLWWRVWVAS